MAKNKNGYSSSQRDTGKIVLICVICVLIGAVLIGGLGIVIYKELSGTATQTVNDKGTDAGDNLPDGELFDYEKAGYMTLGAYKGLKADVEPEEDDVYYEMLAMTNTDELEDKKMIEKVKKLSSVVQDGDLVNVDFSATLDGEDLEDASGEDTHVWIGKKEFIDDFEKGIVGIEVGKTKTVDCTFPTDYDDEDLAGKTVQFTIFVNSRFGADTAKTVSDGKYDSVQAYYDAEYDSQLQENRDMKGEFVWDSIKEASEVTSVPEKMLAQVEVDVKNMYTNFAEMSETTVEDLLAQFGMDEDGIGEIAQDTVMDMMIAKTIAAKENLTMDDEYYKQKLLEMLGEENKDMSLEELEKQFKETQGSTPRNEMWIERVKDFVGEHAKE